MSHETLYEKRTPDGPDRDYVEIITENGRVLISGHDSGNKGCITSTLLEALSQDGLADESTTLLPF